MLIGVVQLELSIPWADCLKDKRRAIKGLKERLHRRFNVSAAEVGDPDIWRTAVLGIAAVANDAQFLQSVCQKVVNFVEENGDTVLDDFSIEII
ncbi:MAG: DUF503 domain-containing protein [Planctomycetota bacterium]